jgi:hypothetical protein
MENDRLRRWRDLAEEARAYAAMMDEADAQTTMLKVAEQYDNLVRRMNRVTLRESGARESAKIKKRTRQSAKIAKRK